MVHVFARFVSKCCVNAGFCFSTISGFSKLHYAAFFVIYRAFTYKRCRIVFSRSGFFYFDGFREAERFRIWCMFVVVKVQEFVHYVPRFAGVCEQFLREMADLFSERILFSKVFYFGRILFSGRCAGFCICVCCTNLHVLRRNWLELRGFVFRKEFIFLKVFYFARAAGFRFS